MMNRESRIKLYKRIFNKYLGNASGLPPDDWRDAIKAGYLLEGYEAFASHDEAMQKAKERVAQIGKTEIANAFLYSLSTSLCEYRSPLLSYYYIKSVEPHPFDASFVYDGKTYHTNYCSICKYNNDKKAGFTTSFYNGGDNFNAATCALLIKYLTGTVCWWAYYIDNCILDITEYLTMPKVEASARDKDIFIAALDFTKTLKPTDKAGAYIRGLHQSKIIPNSTKAQISAFVDTLGSLNILHKDGDYAITKGKDKYDSTYRDPKEHKNDHPFPLTHWTASDGIDWDEVGAIFDI